MSASTSVQCAATSKTEALAPAVRLRGIAKSFGGTRALDGVDLDLSSGEAHGLIGENGAGKSTLMRILAGFFSDYGGQIAIEGQAVRLTSPAQARGRGVALVHQELSLLPELTVAENILLGREPRGTVPGFIGFAVGRSTFLEPIVSLRAGKIKYREHVVQGLDSAPEAFLDMLAGRNFGKVVVALGYGAEKDART